MEFTHWNQDQTLLAAPLESAVSLSHEEADLASRVHGAADPPLDAVDDVIVAVSRDAGGRGDVRWFGHGEAGADLALEQRHQPGLTLRRRSVLQKHLHVARIRCGAVKDFRRYEALAGFLGDVGVFGVGQSCAEILLWVGLQGNEEIPEALALSLRLQRLHPRPRRPLGPRVGRVRHKLLLAGNHARLDESADALVQVLRATGEARRCGLDDDAWRRGGRHFFRGLRFLQRWRICGLRVCANERAEWSERGCADV
jgi:hypothetical protein